MAMDNLKWGLDLIITAIILLLLVGVGMMWGYNFIAQSDSKLFDDENKYIDATLDNPDVEDNYKSGYSNKNKLDGMFIGILSFFGTLKGILFIAFWVLLLLGLILKNRESVLNGLKNMFD